MTTQQQQPPPPPPPNNEAPLLQSLKRLDSTIHTITARARHVAVYRFRQLSSTEEWEREGIEGGLYCVRRTTSPCVAICILNRLNTVDLFQPIIFEFDFEIVQQQYLIYRKQKEIKAIWFSSIEEIGPVAHILEMAVNEMKTVPPMPTFISRPTTTVGLDSTGNHILSKDEMRDAFFRLLNNDSFVDTLYAQYRATEERKRGTSSAAVAAATTSTTNQAVS
jgi:hypothetical protein